MSNLSTTSIQGVYRTTGDINGNPRYIVGWWTLNLHAYESTKLTRSLGLRKYNNKTFGGGFVFQSYNLESSMEFFTKKIQGYYGIESIADLKGANIKYMEMRI